MVKRSKVVALEMWGLTKTMCVISHNQEENHPIEAEAEMTKKMKLRQKL